MKISRRKLLIGSAASLAVPQTARAIPPGTPPPTGITNFVQGALGGGGYACGIAIAPDASSMLMRSDTGNLYRFNPSLVKWQNVSVSPNMDSCGVGAFVCGGVYEIAYAPSNPLRAYAVILNMPTTAASGGRPSTKSYVLRSDDGGITWSKTTNTAVSGGNTNKFAGPHMSVDPHNADIVYLMAAPGNVYVTYNGGSNWSRVDALLSALPSCTATASENDGGNTVAVNSNPIAGAAASVYAAYDATHELALGTNGPYDLVGGGSTSTSFSVGMLESYNGKVGAGSVRKGDSIYFGLGGGVCIDGSSGTVANPGIALNVPGATGVASKVIYFSWLSGASSMWWTQDGGATFAAMSGGPSLCGGKMQLSNDAALTGGGNNVLYVAEGPPPGTSRGAWRYVATPPAGSGLSANTWTHMPLTNAAYYIAFCPDPTTAGKVCYVSFRGGTVVSLDYGATNGGAYNGLSTQRPGSGGIDCPWLSCGGDGVSMGDARFDPVTPEKLWILDGVGVWYTTPLYSRARPTWYSQSSGMDSLTVNRIVKSPSPNGRILLGCEDRPFFSLVDAYTEPAAYYPISQNVNHAGDIVYSDNDPTVVFASAGSQIFRSTNKGIDGWAIIASGGLNGWGGGIWSMLASISPTQCIAVPSDNSGNIQYGSSSDGGTTWTWTNTLLGGNRIVARGSGSAFGTTKCVTSDGNGNIYFYNGGVSGGGPALYKSTDGGAKITLVSNPKMGVGSGAILKCVPGHSGHLFYSPGAGGAHYTTTKSPLYRTTDDGVTWSPFSNTYYIWGVAVGKSAPGNSYPTVFACGSLDTSYNWGLFRCDNMPATGTTCTWTRLDNLKKVNCEGYYGGLDGNMSVYGDVYIAFGSTGYAYGKLS